ncbi:FAD-binding oxidoreductase [Goodfellowiella coeruleoviolacea]|nr:FAD-binding oxidoreductase [Goodfellowiella coeruleoviolacea]
MTENRDDLISAGATWDDVVGGAVRRPDSAGYDDERVGFQLVAAHRPAVVVAARNSDDIRAAVRFAAAEGVPVAVQATGHGLATPLDGTGVLISTRRMTAVTVNAAERTAWVEAGARWRDVIDAAGPHGLAPLSGSLPGVGAVSYTLGGGVGLMARRYGFAADHVRRIDLVTADGRLRRVTATGDPDLFWALRGGGGNFGVVTGMEIDLVPVDRIHGGGLFFDLARTPELAAEWYRWTASLPEEMTSAVSMLPFPDLPGIPEPLRGRHVGQIQIAFLGSAKDGDELVAPLRALGPVFDGLQEIPYAESAVVFNEPDQPHAYQGENLLLRDVEPTGLPALTTLSAPTNPTMCVVGLRHLGGALSRPPAVPNSVGHRAAGYLLGVLSPTTPNQVDAVRAMHATALEPWSAHAVGRSLNFTFGAVDQDTVRAAFAPQDYRRITEIKAALDPQLLFRPNFLIPPSADS